jgi:FAD/FMN-containing dehydrogenase
MPAIHMTGLDGDQVEIRDEAREAFSSRLEGPVLLPGGAGFADAVRIWNGMVAKTPALVVQPVSAGDVREAVGFARAHGLLLSIKGGGHNIAGTSLADGGLTLDMSRMKTVEVDPGRRIARVGPGCLLGDVDRVTQEHGLATVLGFVSQTGVAGLALGGGFGYLTRRFGWTVDNLVEVEIVTADGEVRRAAADEHEDLFWAVRGGGGNFGVVTRFDFRLHEVGPGVTGGLVLWPSERADEVMDLYRDLTAGGPRELTLVMTMRLAPPAPFIPEPFHGHPVVGMLLCHTGDPSRAAEDVAPIRSLGDPVADLIVEKRYVEQQSMLDATQPKGLHNYWKSEFFAGLSDDLMATFRDNAYLATSVLSQSVIFQLGGALAELDPATGPFANRDAAHIYFAAASWPPNAPDGDRHRAWARSSWEAVRPYRTGGNYVNVQTFDDDDVRLREAYGDSFGRLAQVKATYDPENLFRVNRNIPPAG